MANPEGRNSRWLNWAAMGGAVILLGALKGSGGAKPDFDSTISTRFGDFAASKARIFPSADLLTVPVNGSLQLSQVEFRVLPREHLSDASYYKGAAATECAAVLINGLKKETDKTQPGNVRLNSAEQNFLDGLSLMSVSVPHPSASDTEARMNSAAQHFEDAFTTCQNVLNEVADSRRLKYPAGLK